MTEQKEKRRLSFFDAIFYLCLGVSMIALTFSVKTLSDEFESYQEADLLTERLQNFNTAALLWLYYDSNGLEQTPVMIEQMRGMCDDLGETGGVCEDAYGE